MEANSNVGAHDTILFNLAADTIPVVNGQFSIFEGVTIDGTNQNATFPGRVQITGQDNSDGIVVEGGTGSIIRDLVVNQFIVAIAILGSDPEDPETTGNKIAGCRIGTDRAGLNQVGNEIGILLDETRGNIIGGTTVADRNLVSGNFQRGIQMSEADFNVIRGNRIGTNATGTDSLGNGNFDFPVAAGILLVDSSDNIIGGKTANARNLISGNFGNGVSLVDEGGGGSDRNRIEGNYIGVNVNGTDFLENGEAGIFVDAFSARNTMGGTVPGARNVISGNNVGIQLEGDLNVIQGNFIGTNAAGTASIENDGEGIFLTQSAALNTVGGPSPGARNVISGNDAEGIVNDGARTLIQGNYIGVGADGTTPLGNGAEGVDAGEAGGNHDILGNIIAHNNGDGVEIEFDASNDGNAILGNSIFDNDLMGIDLERPGGVVGVTPNDNDDVDSGQPNRGQNFPVILRAVRAAKAVTIDTFFNSTPSTTFRIEFFANATCDETGNGEGETLLGATSVTTNSGGNVTFSVTLLGNVAAGQQVTATATSTGDDTSEFSLCANVEAPAATCQGMPADIVGTIASNNITGTSGADVIDGGEGDDTISALGGDDRVCGGADDDTVSGGSGVDRLNGESGNDTLNGDAGNDVLNGGSDTDVCNGGAGSGDTALNCETTAGIP